MQKYGKLSLIFFVLGILLIGSDYVFGTTNEIINVPMNQTLTNYGTIPNTVTPSQSTNYLSIVNNAGINFTGGYYLQLVNQVGYDISKTDPLSINFVLNDTYAYPLLVARSSVNYVQGYSLEMYNGQMLWNIIGTWGSDTVTVGTGSYRFDDGKLHFVTVTKSSGNPFTLKIYDNATLINSISGSISGSITNTNPIYIGAGSGDSRQVQGQMAYFSMWNTELTQQQITDQFNSIFNPQPTKQLSDTLQISDNLSINYTHTPTNTTLSLSDTIPITDSVTEQIPSNQAYGHFNSTIFLTANTHLDYQNATLKMVDNFHNTNSFFSFVNASGTDNVSIANANLDCGNLNRLTDVISGTYLVNGNNESLTNIKVFDCDHVGLYFKGFTNSHIENITTTKTISHGSAVGTGFAAFGGSNNVIKNIVSNNNCGNLGEGIQIESNDEALSPPEYMTNTQFIGITSSNNCGDGFIASNLGTGNSLLGFYMYNDTNGIVLASGQPMSISQGTIWNMKNFGMHLSSYGNTISYVTIGQDYDGKGKVGIVADGANGLVLDHVTFINMPLGIDIQTNNVSITNSCFINTPVHFVVKAGFNQPTVTGSSC